jgi:hypothetical protein
MTKGSDRIALKMLNRDPLTFGGGGGLYEIAGAGFGFFLTHIEAFDALHGTDSWWMVPECAGDNEPDSPPIRPYFQPIWRPDPESGRLEYHTEDYSVCARWRAAGLSLFCDTKVPVAHAAKRYLTVLDVLREQ